MNQAIYDSFKAKLQEIFMTDRADLDFGIYRIMNLKRREIDNFLSNKLLKEADTAIKQNKPADSKMSVADMENSIFTHLTDFFSRYYDDGDFVSARRYGNKSAYMIPYDGEEVKLHWANKDQYYIKTTEDFKDYQFKLDDGSSVHFVLKDAATGQNNNIPDKNSARRFRLWKEGDCVEKVSDDVTNIYFTYELEKKVKGVTQNSINTSTLTRIQLILNLSSDNWDKVKKHLGKYTSSNSFDYFIHKNLKEFLSREFEYFIKKEVLQIDNLNPVDLATQIVLINVLKDVGEKIIAFLAQLEDFQKKLWLKKKFVLQSDYCITLDHIIRICDEDYDDSLLETIAGNQDQIDEWKKLFAIDKITGDSDHMAFSEPISVDFLKENPYLLVDTKFFDFAFKAKVLREQYNLDKDTDGLLVSSENFQALNLLQNRYRNSVDCVYIDPPYNSPSSVIAYKNNFKHSSWLSLMENRLKVGKLFLTSTGSQVVAIDKYEHGNLYALVDQMFASYDLVDVTIEHNKKGTMGDHFSYNNEYAIFAVSNSRKTLNTIPRPVEMWDWSSFRNWGSESERADAANCYFPVFIEDENIIGYGNVCENDEHPSMNVNVINDFSYYDYNGNLCTYTQCGRNVVAIYPNDVTGIERKWRYAFQTMPQIIPYLRIKRASGFLQIEMPKMSDQFKTMWYDAKYNAGDFGTKILTNMGIDKALFQYPKSLFTTRDCIYSVSDCDALIIDYFAGSGTTGHAVTMLNREDGGNRKYILVEMGEYFDTVTKPRVEKSVYSTKWNDGVPTTRDGISQIIKCIRLEQYEDTLDNLSVSQQAQAMVFDDTDNSFQESYKINNMLDAEFTDSLLNLSMFDHPFDNEIKTTMYNESKMTKVDMVDTFNYLIGLKVNHIDYVEEFDFKLCVVDGYVNNSHVLVIWRDLEVINNETLQQYLDGGNYNLGAGEYDTVYINGDNNIQNMSTDEKHFKVECLEEVFINKMFEEK